MVKTLNFHFKNVGSSPASLIMYSLTPCLRKKRLALRQTTAHRVSYSIRLVSLFAPSTIRDLRLLFHSTPKLSDKNGGTPKILLKQSYILLVWFYYLTAAYSDKEEGDAIPVPGFFIFPKKSTKFTLLKAPMAHKTFSQEQFVFVTYRFSLTLNVDLKCSPPSQKDLAVAILSYFDGLHLFYGTNMLFLRNFTVLFLIGDRSYFSYYFFTKTFLRP